MVASMRNTGINPNPMLNTIIPYYLKLGKTYLILYHFNWFGHHTSHPFFSWSFQFSENFRKCEKVTCWTNQSKWYSIGGGFIVLPWLGSKWLSQSSWAENSWAELISQLSDSGGSAQLWSWLSTSFTAKFITIGLTFKNTHMGRVGI